jgi:hypothetical protein
MGWLAVALGFGLSFGVVGSQCLPALTWLCLQLDAQPSPAFACLPSRPHLLLLLLLLLLVPPQVIMMLGYISAHLNPATCLALWVIGKVRWRQCAHVCVLVRAAEVVVQRSRILPLAAAGHPTGPPDLLLSALLRCLPGSACPLPHTSGRRILSLPALSCRHVLLPPPLTTPLFRCTAVTRCRHSLPPLYSLSSATCFLPAPPSTTSPPALQIPFTHFLALAGAEFAGAFVGACLVFLHYIPHFKTVPEPMPRNEDDVLLRRWVGGW